jgi:hypothetical protein
MLNKLAILTLITSFSISVFSQTTNTKKWRKTENDSMQNALFLFDESKFAMALPIYENLYKSHPKEDYLKYCYGKCALYRSDRHDVALELLTQMYAKNKKIGGIQYDLARANHYNYKFDEAIALLDAMLAKKKISPDDKKNALQLKQYCINAKDFYANPTGATINNIGDVINTESDEYVPVISADESVMIYTYRGPQSVGGLQNEFRQPDPYGTYFEDIFTSYKLDGKWMKPTPIANINTNSHDAAIGLSPDGNYLFVYRDNGDDHGDIYMSNSINGTWSEPKKLNGDVNSYSWEGSCSMTADGKYLYFSSERGGGYGGKDIYRATLLADSTWGHVVNLGDSINTALDDDAPFIHPDGVTLFYSSQGKNSMGGYDIFQAKLNWLDSTFSKPVNLGYPINTPDDDIYYVLSARGDVGYYASGKKGGQGLKDIYNVSPGYVGKRPSLYLVKGRIALNGSSVEANIDVEIVTKNNQVLGVYRSNAVSGQYLISLPSGGEFRIVYKYKQFAPKTLDVNTTGIDGYEEKVFDVNFLTTDTLKPLVANVPKADSLIALAVKEPVKKPVKEPVVKKEPVKEPVVKEEPVAAAPEFKPTSPIQQKTLDYSLKYGDISADDLIFKVQIAAYKYPKNYVYSHLKGLGEVERLLLEDGITRITIGGNFPTLNKAFEHNKKVVARGQKDAFVTMLYKGKRVYLEDLEKLGIFVEKKE